MILKIFILRFYYIRGINFYGFSEIKFLGFVNLLIMFLLIKIVVMYDVLFLIMKNI